MSRHALTAMVCGALWLGATPAAAQPVPAVAEPAGAAQPLPSEPLAPVVAEPAPAASAPAPSPVEPAPAATLPPPAAAEDTAFALDPSAGGVMVGEDAPKLELYGFADFSYFHVLGEKDNVLRQYVAPYPSFYVGHLNLYLSSTFGDNWRSLAEVRFVYSPLGDEDTPAPDGTFPVADTTAVDYAELQRNFSWGGIEIQRVWIEYQPFDFLSIRGGQWFTPYGYWNDDHGSPTIITVHKPFPIGDAFFPERQTGIELHGKYFVDSTAIGYALTLSNGRGPYDSIRDLDNNKAIGGRLYLETNGFGNLTLGVDAYRGRFTASTKRYQVDSSSGEPVTEIYRSVDAAYDELSLGADVRLLWKGLHLQGEFMINEAAYDERYRPRTVGFDPEPTFAADYRRIGAYLLLGYRTPFLGIMPYVMAEHSSYTNTDLAPPVWAYSAGLNVRPTPNVVLKAELALAQFTGQGSTGLGADDLQYFGSQAAWAF